MWQRIYEEINDPNFVLICAAEDTGGEAAAGPIFDAANPTYIQVIDENHLISSAFNFVNVPSAAWIDETGQIVRIDEGTYSMLHSFGEGEQAISFGTDVYEPALKDWVAKGADSEHVQSAETVAGNIRQHSSDQQKADAAFRLGNLFRMYGQEAKADQYCMKYGCAGRSIWPWQEYRHQKNKGYSVEVCHRVLRLRRAPAIFAFQCIAGRSAQLYVWAHVAQQPAANSGCT